MNILVIDGQGGGLGKALVSSIKAECPTVFITAVGTNSMATSAMLKAGAHQSATGENAVVVACRKADIIAGPLGIVIADALVGEITPKMSIAIGQSMAKRVLIPLNLCDNVVVGIERQSMTVMVQKAVETVKAMIGDCQ